MSRSNRQTTGPQAGRTANARKPSAVSRKTGEETARELEKGAAEQRPRQYLLRLYVTGATPASERAIAKVRSICDEHLHGRYALEVFDIYQMPALAKDHQIIATPTLIRVLPAPLRRYIGDLSKVEGVLFGVDVKEKRDG